MATTSSSVLRYYAAVLPYGGWMFGGGAMSPPTLHSLIAIQHAAPWLDEAGGGTPCIPNHLLWISFNRIEKGGGGGCAGRCCSPPLSCVLQRVQVQFVPTNLGGGTFPLRLRFGNC